MLHRYFIKTPWYVKRFFSSYVWNQGSDDHSVYLTFDDGPDPEITPWVLDELAKYKALATFFCVGSQVNQFPEVYQRILDQHHAVGNHSYSHYNGWETEEKKYIDDVSAAAVLIHSRLFRPPYGRIRKSQAKKIAIAMQRTDAQIIMWDVLSADFDPSFSPSQCLSNVLDHVTAGSIVVFHDSQKASQNLYSILPKIMEVLHAEGYQFKKLE